MIRVLLDTNLVLDALLGRSPWNTAANAVFEANMGGRVSVSLTATTLTDVYNVIRRGAHRARAWEAVRACLDQFRILTVNHSILREAAALSGDDFEDKIQIAAAGRATGPDPPTGHPLMTPTGRSRATFFEMPALSTTSTT